MPPCNTTTPFTDCNIFHAVEQSIFLFPKTFLYAYYTAGIRGDYDENTTIDSSFHKALLKNIMSRIHTDLDYKEFEIPDSIETATICTKSGKLAVTGLCDAAPGGSTVQEEYFAKGSTPTDPNGTTKDTPYYLPDNITNKVCSIHGQGGNSSNASPSALTTNNAGN